MPQLAIGWPTRNSSGDSNVCARAIKFPTSRSRRRRRKSFRSSIGISESGTLRNRAMPERRPFDHFSAIARPRCGVSRSSRPSPSTCLRTGCTRGISGRTTSADRRRRRWRGSSARTSSVSNTTSICSGWRSSSLIGSEWWRGHCGWESGFTRIWRSAWTVPALRFGRTKHCSRGA